jgi:RNA polymerase sigma-70 factor (ECF subfamily)
MAAPDSPAPETPDGVSGAKQPTSLTLLQRLRVHDADAWQTLVKLYTPLVYYWCARGGVRGADAEDVAQDVFQAAATHLEQFRRDRPGDSFRGWLRGITRNMVLQHFRRDKRQPKGSGGTDAVQRLQAIESSPGADADQDSVEEMDGLRRRALELVRSEFEDRTWQAFWLTVVESRSPVDIAAEMGVSPAAVRMAKSRVLHRLKEEFGELIN